MGEAKRRRQHLTDNGLIEVVVVDYGGKLYHVRSRIIEGLLNCHDPDNRILSVVSSPEESQLIQEILWDTLDAFLEKYGHQKVTYSVRFDTKGVLHTKQALLAIYPQDWELDPSQRHNHRFAIILFESAEKRLVAVSPDFFERHNQN